MRQPSDRQPRKPMVLHVVHHLDLGGSEEIALSLAEQLHDDYDVRFFAVQGVKQTDVGQAMKRRLDHIGVSVYSGTRLDLKRGGFLVAAARLAALTQRHRPDIVHLHTEIPELTHAFSQGFLGQASGRSAQLVRTLHNTVYWGPWQRLGAAVERRLSEVAVAACSHAALEGMQSFRRSRGVPPLSHSRVIYNGVAPAKVRKQPTGSAGPLQVLFAGRLEPQKGADLLPAIVARASELGHPPANLTIYGAGSLGPELERWAAQTLAPEGPGGWKIDVRPPTSRLRDLMAEADLLLMPSRFEGLPLVAAEALMAGLPVVGTSSPGMTEVFPVGYPLLAPSEDTEALGQLLAQVLNEAAHYQALAEGWVGPITDRFGVARMAREYGELYQGLLQGQKVNAPQPSGAM